MCAGSLLAQPKKILVMGASPDIVKELETAAGSKGRIVTVTNQTVAKEIADADAIIGNITPEWVRAGKKLKWVQIRSAGSENALHLSGGNDLRDSQIVLTNNQIVQGPEIADHAMAMLLAHTRRLLHYQNLKAKSTWQGGNFTGIELNTKNAVIIGCGGIGMQIATRAWAFGMNNVCVDPEDLPYSPFVKRTVKPDLLNEVIPSADVVFIAAPWTPESHKMFGPSQFDLMKPSSYFIAVSRGGLYDLNALVKALDSKKIAGAGVDVVDAKDSGARQSEPLPADHPLWKFENVIITPHIAGRSDLDAGRMNATIKENVKRFVDGKPLINVVDKHKGY
jgi:phosphoglycerate dehydrogenase-like enzyme